MSKLASTLSYVVALFTLMTTPASAVSYDWNTATAGNWTTGVNWVVGDGGHPDDATDDATISGSGSAYTVTLDANKTTGEFAISSVDATLSTGANTLTVDGNASTTTNPGLFNHTAGGLNGNFQFIKADVDLTNATSTSATVFDFRQFTACCGSQASSIDFGSNEEITSNQTLKVFAVDSKGIIDLTTTGDVTNKGTVDLTTQGINSGGNQNHINWALTGGTLTNQNQLTLASNRATGSAQVTIDADLINDTGATLDASTPTSGHILLTKVAATHVNRADWNVTGTGSGMTIIGDGTSLTQSTAGASLDAVKLKLGTGGASPDTVQNTFSMTAGSLSGFLTLAQTAATLGAGVTFNAPTTFKFDGETLNSFTGDVPADLTLQLHTIGISEGAIVSTPGSVVNDGTISILSTGAGFNLGYGQLNIGGGGTLTNNGTVTADTQVSAYGLTANSISGDLVNNSILNFLVTNNHVSQQGRTVLSGDLTNESAGTVTVNVTGTGPNKEVRFADGVSGTYINRGQFNVVAGLLNLNGGTLDNESTGTLGGNGTLSGDVDNDGTISPGLSAGILTVDGATQFNAGSQLVMEITGSGEVAGTDFDQLIVSGAVTGLTDADLVVNIGSGLDLTDDVFSIMTTSSDLTGLSFGSVTFNGPGDSAFIGTVTYGNGFVELSNIGSVPEPSTGMLLALAGMIAVMRRRRRYFCI